MASYTENLSLEKPAEDEFYDINKINANMDKIDAAITSGQTETGKKMEHDSPEGAGSLSMNRKTSTEKGANSATIGTDGTASGNSAVAEGNITTASGNYSHAEGNRTTASGTGTHAEGDQTTASGDYSHAEGELTTASGNDSHAEGSGTSARGAFSHAQNYSTVANGQAQTVLGKFNEPDETSAVIIGNGTSDDARSNALKIGWDGSVQSSGRLQSAKETQTVQLSNGASGTMELYRKGDLVMAIIAGGVLSAGTNDRVIGTIPEGWRPPRQIQMILDGTSSFSYIFINSYGQVKCNYTSGSGLTVYAKVTYISWG